MNRFRSFFAAGLCLALTATLVACGNADTATSSTKTGASSSVTKAESALLSDATVSSDSVEAVSTEAVSSTAATESKTTASKATASKGTVASSKASASTATESKKPVATSSAASTSSKSNTTYKLTAIATSAYHGRSQLSGDLLKAYDALVSAVEKTQETIDLKAYGLSKTDLEKVLTYYRADYPQHFWLGTQYSYTMSNNVIKLFKPTYSMTGSALTKAKAAVDSAVQTVLAGVAKCETEYERELYVHDYLCDTVTYDMDAANAHTIYGALVDKKAVCEGYAKAFQYILNQAGVECLYVTGQTARPADGVIIDHAWNLVKISGSWYHMDVTWDDQDPYRHYCYFNATDSDMSSDHAVGDSKENYALPSCTSLAQNYFVKINCRLASFDLTAVCNAYKNGNALARFYVTGDMKAFYQSFKSNINTIAKTYDANIGKFKYKSSVLGHELIVVFEKA